MLAQLDQWLLGPGEVGWVMITGGPGMGKSALLSAWLTRREIAGTLVPHHFIRRQVANWDQPEVIAASLAAQIEAMFPMLRDTTARPEGRLIELLGRVSQHVSVAEPVVIVIDGLDETDADLGDNLLPRFLPHLAPAGIRILCSMRPNYPHLHWLETRSPARLIDLDAHRWAASNEKVIAEFWQAAANEYEPPLPVETVIAAINNAEGNVLHAVMLHDALQELPAHERRANQIPRGLRGLIDEIWDRVAVHPPARVGLGLLCAAQEALSLDVIAELAGWGPDAYEEQERFLREARQLLLEEPASWSGTVAYRPRHDWVRQLMSHRIRAAALRAHHQTLSRKLATWPAPIEPAARRYTLRYALLHRAEANAWEEAWHLAANLSFVETKCRELGVAETGGDVARIAERCQASGNELLSERFDDLARALGRESHWLQAAPEATAALVWNRLRHSGWSTVEIERQVQLPAGLQFLRIRHLATRESSILVRDLVGHASSVVACEVLPDGRRMVSASSDQTLKVWDLETGKTVATLTGHAGVVSACAVTPDGRRVVSASYDQTLKVWDLETGRAVATLTGHTGIVSACAVTPDSRRVISASYDQTLKVWDLETGYEVATLAGHVDRVTACAVFPNGRRIVSASWDQTLQVWDLETGRSMTMLVGHAARVIACAITPDGQRVVSASGDQTLKVWDPKTGHTLATLAGHTDTVTACAVTPDGRRVVSASWDRTLKLWDLETGQVQATLAGHSRIVSACTVTPNQRWVVSASYDQLLKVWDIETDRAIALLAGHANSVGACAADPTGRWAVSASWDHTIKVWDVETGRAMASLEGHTGWVLACAVTQDGRQVVSASWDHTLKVWNIVTGLAVRTLVGHAASVTACAVTPNGRQVISGSIDHTLKVWDLETGLVIRTLAGHSDSITACAVTPDGQRIVSASYDQTLKVWDLATGHEVATLAGHAGIVTACAVTPDGRRVVSASWDHTLRVWDLETGHAVATLAGHTRWVTSCALTPDGRRMVSASWDHTLKLWDLESDKCLFTHHGNAIYTAATMTATAIIAGDIVGSVWFLDWPSPDRIKIPDHIDRSSRIQPIHSSATEPRPRRASMKHTILFLTANPQGTDARALDVEARAIEVELERSNFRDQFELKAIMAAQPLDLLRELRKLKPTIVHFSGHGTMTGIHPEPGPRRDIVAESNQTDDKPQCGLFFQDSERRPQLVTTKALAETFGAVGGSVKLVVLSACYNDAQARALLPHVDCVVGMSHSMPEAATRSFSVGFYGGLGERESVATAYKQGCAAISLEGLPYSDRPQLEVRAGIDASNLILATPPEEASRTYIATPQRRPLISLFYDARGWCATNIGEAPVTQAVVFIRRNEHGDWEQPVRIAALAIGDTRVLLWIGHRNIYGLGVLYRDIANMTYSTTCHHDANKHSNGNVFPNFDDAEIRREWQR